MKSEQIAVEEILANILFNVSTVKFNGVRYTIHWNDLTSYMNLLSYEGDRFMTVIPTSNEGLWAT